MSADKYTVLEIVRPIMAGLEQGYGQKPTNIRGEMKKYRIVPPPGGGSRILLGEDQASLPLEFFDREVAHDFCRMLNLMRWQRREEEAREAKQKKNPAPG